MGFPRYGAFVGIVTVALAAAPSLRAEGPALALTVEPAGVAMVTIPAGMAPSRVASGAATPSCLISEGQDGQLDFQVSVPSAGGQAGALRGRCSARNSEPARTRYRAVPFAPESIGRPGSVCPTFAPDGRTAVYVKEGSGLVESRRDGGRWTSPEPLPFSGAARDDVPFLSPDGSRLFFRSARATSESGQATAASDLWVVERRTEGWGVPQRLGPPVNDGTAEPLPAVAADGTLYFGSRRPGGRGATDLYSARPSTTGYASPENLGISINTPAAELDGYVSPDQDLLVFASDRPGGFGGLDLYVSHRIVGGWSPARNLGRAVNGPEDEFCPQVTPDGRLLVFSTSKGVFQVDAAILDDATP